ncbi:MULTISPECIES: protein adenylyltransferase SelO [unclassified Aurantimonas]|uniref:protein adenylyltransferase SelO n=1 Tax=unclassified Aurantimonas TaxID=2638230 RepID=UPI002E181A9C|nr:MULTISPECIES: YdiU family protein [unclassified Aurantimonas]MEC5293096.1 YdiU family protein [Aurantimonas sp. C2-3-R2]MEC5414141.1 YdiU family protein [Aurantimonas sp. C2-4-R8]
MTVRFAFDNSYARLPSSFYARVPPTPVSAPHLLKLNRDLAVQLGLNPDELATQTGVEILAGKRIPEGAEPIATAYAGHQFGQFVPQLGDGRAILLGEIVDQEGVRRDIQLKGSGRTPFSRGGDGRAALGPVLREYIVSEAMAAVGIPTTRALAAVMTGDEVIRETYLPGAVLTRVASSHIRIGTFQFFAARGDVDAVRALADHAIARHYPNAAGAIRPYLALLESVIARQAYLVAQWLVVGFIHGVMNTDNMSIAGETIDYGPCAFLDIYNPNTVFSSIDQLGRYAYANQPAIAQWNLTRLAECLLPLLAEDQDKAVEQAQEALSAFTAQFSDEYNGGLRRKLGLLSEREGDLALTQELLERMATGKADFTLTFRRLSEAAIGPEGDVAVRSLFEDPATYDEWAGRWRHRLGQEPQEGSARRASMQRVNPAFIPRNHRVEAVIEAAVEKQEFGPFDELLTVLSRPYEDQPAFASYAEPPSPDGRIYKTFCGT